MTGKITGWTASAAFDRMLESLERTGVQVTGSGRQRQAQCPAHDDRNPSLSVTDGTDRVLVHCHGGCCTDDVLAALRLTRGDLFSDRKMLGPDNKDIWAPWQRDKCPCSPVARYSYVDETGRLLFEVVRGEHKEFSQRRPDSASRSGWRWSGISEVRHVLFRLPAVLTAPDHACIWVTEGEKDVLALEAAGEIATCPPGGAGKWRSEYAETLTGRDVLIVADRDAPDEHGRRAGADHAWDVFTSVLPVARSAWIVQAAEGKDAADHLAAGRDVTEFVWWALWAL